MKKYAQIDKNNICNATATSSKDKSLLPDNWILISNDYEALGKRYNNGVWEEVPQPEPEPTQLDRIEERLNLSYTEAQEQAVDLYTQKLIEEGNARRAHIEPFKGYTKPES